MILTDREIQVALATDQIKIDPEPVADAFSSSSLDLTLGTPIRVWKKASTGRVISPADAGYQYAEVVREMADAQEIASDGYVISPGELLLGWTAEVVELPIRSRLAARVEGKSSLARLGIGVHVTAPTIHAGFQGSIQLEICNHGPLHVRLTPGLRVCQLIFEQTLGTPEKGYTGQFLGQVAE
jgi:dCTP deaminase